MVEGGSFMLIPRELTPADCPLLRDTPELRASDLIDQFNSLVRRVKDLDTSKLAYLTTRPDVAAIISELDRVRGQLTRPRYRVGFLGTSQAGKSTTFNNVLQESIAQSGIGDATTSLITRTHRIPSGGNTLTLRYLTLEQYQDRRDRLCKALFILNAATKPNAEILAYLADPQKVVAAPAGDLDSAASRQARRAGEHAILPDDIPYLRDFLRAFDSHGQRVVREGNPHEITAPYERRGHYVNHSTDPTGVPSENYLLREADIGCANENIPAELEAIDCPGLGSKRSVDTVMTREFLGYLDGAFIFVLASQLRSKDVVDILETLKVTFGRLEGRVWVVVNKFDTLTHEPLFGDANGNTVFDLIRQFLDDYGIPASQVVFTSNKVFALPKDANGRVPIDRAADRLGVPAADPIPPKCRADSGLAEAFGQLIADGGIAHLRQLIRRTVADAVAAQIGGGARRELDSLADELTRKIETENRRVSGGRQQRDHAITCHDTVLELLLEVGTHNELFRPLADHIQQKLLARLTPSEQRERVIQNLTVDELARQFELHADTLTREVDDLINADVIDRLYGEIADKLDGLPQIPIDGAGSVRDAWQAYRKQDRDPYSWRTESFPTFRSPELFAGLIATDVFSAFDGDAYLDLMREKIRVATHQVMHSVRVQLRRRLRALEQELALLIWNPA